MMKTLTLLFTAASLMLFTSGVTAGHHNKSDQANKPHQMQRGATSYKKMLEGIELSSEQKQQFQQLMAEHRANKPQRERGQKARGAMRELMQADHFDDVAVTALLQQQQEQRLAQRVARLKLRHQVYQILSPEQREQLTANQQQRKHNWQQNRKGANNP